MTPLEPRGGEGSVGQRAFEWMRDGNNALPGARKDLRVWDDLSEADRQAFEEDATRRPSLYRGRRPSSPPSGGGRWPSREEVARVFAEDILAQAERVSIRPRPGKDSFGIWSDKVRCAAVLALFPPVVGWRPIDGANGVPWPGDDERWDQVRAAW